MSISLLFRPSAIRSPWINWSAKILGCHVIAVLYSVGSNMLYPLKLRTLMEWHSFLINVIRYADSITFTQVLNFKTICVNLRTYLNQSSHFGLIGNKLSFWGDCRKTILNFFLRFMLPNLLHTSWIEIVYPYSWIIYLEIVIYPTPPPTTQALSSKSLWKKSR